MMKILSLTLFILFQDALCGVINSKEFKCISEEHCYDRNQHPILDSFRFSDFSNEFKYEESNEFWLENAKKHVIEQTEKRINENIAKNVIFFLGDGMSLTTLAATRAYIGGEEKYLSFEKFPYTGLVRTYCLDKKTPDSASTSTAYLSGVKANYGTIGVNGYVKRQDCETMLNENTHTHSIGSWALDAGKSAGFVTTTRVTHASPAGLYAHTADRNWENDSELKKYCDNKAIHDIAYQLVYGSVGKRLKVALGGGRSEFCDNNLHTSERVCLRSDGKNLTSEWLEANKTERRVYVENRKQLNAVDPANTDRLLGLFQDDHLLYHLEAEALNKTDEQPTLEEMTKKAIEVLRTNEKGYFLFVEGGKIDIAHHSVYAKIAFDETSEFSKAIQTARAMTSENDTLIVVSSDHSHTMSISGYPHRHQNILGISQKSDVDRLSYMTINYANGQAFDTYFNSEKNERVKPEAVTKDSVKMQFPSTVPLKTETHGAEDVAVFASGPWAHLFTGTYEQNALPHLMAYASCIGQGLQACKKN